MTRRQYRFGFTGAQGVGKSTLARAAFAECMVQFPGKCQLLDGIGDSVRRLGYPLAKSATIDTIVAFAAEHLRRERSAEGQIVLLDRCLLDLLGYVRTIGQVDVACRRLIEELCILTLPSIDSLFYIPICSELAESHSPYEDTEFRARTDAEIAASAHELGIEVITVTGTRAERLATVMSVITKLAAASRP